MLRGSGGFVGGMAGEWGRTGSPPTARKRGRSEAAIAVAAAWALGASTIGFAGLAEATIVSSVSAYTIYYDESGVPIAEEEDYDDNSIALVTARASTLVCRPGDICVIIPNPNPPWYWGTSSAAEARTDYGVNRARASAGENSVHENGFTDGQNDAGALSEWTDTLTLLFVGGVPPSDPLEIDIHAGGSWENQGSYTYSVGLYDPSAPEPGEPGSSGLPLDYDGRYADIFNCPYSSPCNTSSFDPRYQLVQAGDDLDPDGTVDETVTLSMPYVPGKQLVLYGRLEARAGNGYQDARVEAFSGNNGVVEIRVPAGALLVSAAGAHGNYNIVVPEPGAGLLFGASFGVLASLKRRASARTGAARRTAR